MKHFKFFLIPYVVLTQSLLSMHPQFTNIHIQDWKNAHRYIAIDETYALTKNKNGNTPLHYVVKKPFKAQYTEEHNRIASLLICFKASCTATDQNGQMPLHIMTKLSNNYIDIIVQNTSKENINNKDNKNNTALDIALRTNKNDLIKQLLAHGANQTKYTVNAFQAAFEGCLAKTTLAVNQNYNVLQWRGGKFPQELMQDIASYKNIKIPIIFAEKDKLTLLNVAVKAMSLKKVDGEHEQIIEYLIAQHANAHIPDSHGATPLHWAVRTHNIAIIKKLLAYDKSVVNYQTEQGNTPLHWAAEITDHKNLFVCEIAALLIHYNADVNIQNAQLNTPLHIAQHKGNTALFNYLKKHKAESVANKDGLTPEDIPVLQQEHLCIRRYKRK